MKILIVAGIFPPDIGGPATYTAHTAQALSGRGHDVTVLTLSDTPGAGAGGSGYPVVRVRRRLPRPIRQLLTVVLILRFGRRVHALFVNGLFLESVLANVFLRKPMIQKVVGDMAWERTITLRLADVDFETFQRKPLGPRIELLKFLRRQWTAHADVIIVPSRYLARVVVNWGIPERKIVVIPNSPAPGEAVPPAMVPVRVPVTAVTVGRLVRWKRIDQIIAAMAPLEDLGLVVVGDGPEREALEALIRTMRLGSRVHLASQRDHQDTLALMSACDIFVLNSTYEGHPHVVLEAMALGLPVVATPAGGTPEIIQHESNGLLVDYTNESLREGLARLIHDADMRKRLGAEGRKSVAQRFPFAGMILSTEAALSDVSTRRN